MSRPILQLGIKSCTVSKYAIILGGSSSKLRERDIYGCPLIKWPYLDGAALRCEIKESWSYNASWVWHPTPSRARVLSIRIQKSTRNSSHHHHRHHPKQKKGKWSIGRKVQKYFKCLITPLYCTSHHTTAATTHSPISPLCLRIRKIILYNLKCSMDRRSYDCVLDVGGVIN